MRAAQEAPGWARRQRRSEYRGQEVNWASRFGWAGSGPKGLSLIGAWPCVTWAGGQWPRAGAHRGGDGLWALIGGFACERSPLPRGRGGGTVYPLQELADSRTALQGPEGPGVQAREHTQQSVDYFGALF